MSCNSRFARSTAIVAGLLMAIGSVRPGNATDLGFLWPATDAELGAISWTGLIINPDAGYETLKLGGAPKGALKDPKGWRAGGELGYDLQIGNFVIGAAGDGFYSWLEGKGSGSGAARYTAELDYFGTLRARAGFAQGRFLGYATGGWAFGQLEISDKPNNLKDKEFLSGWALGGGFEYVWNRSVTLRAEYLHLDFGKEAFSSLPAVSNRLSGEMEMIKVGLITRF